MSHSLHTHTHFSTCTYTHRDVFRWAQQYSRVPRLKGKIKWSGQFHRYANRLDRKGTSCCVTDLRKKRQEVTDARSALVYRYAAELSFCFIFLEFFQDHNQTSFAKYKAGGSHRKSQRRHGRRKTSQCKEFNQKLKQMSGTHKMLVFVCRFLL